MESITVNSKPYSKSKIVGMVMTVIGMAALFFQSYKIIFPYFYFKQQSQALINVPELDAQTLAYQQKILNQINGVFGIEAKDSTALMLFGAIGFIAVIFYLISGLKLRGKTNINNYKAAKFGIVLFLIYNIAGVIFFYDTNPGFFMNTILVLATVGIIVDSILFVVIKKQMNTMDLDINTMDRKVYFSERKQ